MTLVILIKRIFVVLWKNYAMGRIIYLLTLLFIPGIPGFSQIQLEGQFRPRSEFNYGYGEVRTKHQAPTLLYSHRLRLMLSIRDEEYDLNLSIQDVRTWNKHSISNAKV